MQRGCHFFYESKTDLALLSSVSQFMQRPMDDAVDSENIFRERCFRQPRQNSVPPRRAEADLVECSTGTGSCCWELRGSS